jgi:hypothetical protein
MEVMPPGFTATTATGISRTVTAARGLAGLGATYQAAWADFDNDGDLDLVTDGKLFVNSESNTGSNHWLKLRLQGDGTNVNSAAIGTSARITIGGQTMTRQVEGGTGEGNQNDLTLHFGLGSHSGPVDVDITWADGSSQTLKGLAVDNTYTPPPPPVVTFTLDDHEDGTFDIYASTQPGSSAGISYYNIDLVNILTAEDESPMGFDADALILRGFTIGGADLTGDEALFAAQDSVSGNAPDNLIYGIGQTAGSMNTFGTPRGVPWDEMVLIASGTYTYGGPSPEFGDEIIANIFTEEWIDGEIWEGFIEAADVELVYISTELPIPGDFDLDGDVDGVDFYHWQMGYPTASGSDLDHGDADGDGDTDGIDFGIWQANYPTTLGSAAIPEPATLGLLLGGLTLLCRRRK